MNKKIINVLTVVIAIGVLITVSLNSCTSNTEQTDDRNKMETGRFGNIQTVKYDGHQYLLYNTGVGSSITHKANCKFDEQDNEQ